MPSSGRGAFAALLVALALVVSACGGTEQEPIATVESSSDGYHGARLVKTYESAPTTLQDTEGAPVKLGEGGPRLRLVFFGYTHCPDVCQVVMSTMASALTKLSDAERKQVQGVFVTTDPARDSAATLRSYLDRFDPDFVGLRSSIDDVVAAAEPYGVFIEQGEKLPSGGYEVNHTTAVIGVIEGRGEIVWTQGIAPGELAADIKKLLEENA